MRGDEGMTWKSDFKSCQSTGKQPSNQQLIRASLSHKTKAEIMEVVLVGFISHILTSTNSKGSSPKFYLYFEN